MFYISDWLLYFRVLFFYITNVRHKIGCQKFNEKLGLDAFKICLVLLIKWPYSLFSMFLGAAAIAKYVWRCVFIRILVIIQIY
jgi:hypothetical protein